MFVAFSPGRCMFRSKTPMRFSKLVMTSGANGRPGPYLLLAKSDGPLLGGSGLEFESIAVASTEYILAKDAWGRRLATQGLNAMRELAATLNVERLYTHVQPQHLAFRRVLEKAAIHLDGILLKSFEFLNSGKGELFDVVSYSCRPKELPGEFAQSNESGSDT
jgi:RimJ/RimL family protein N-acetyltransferase